MKSTVEKDFTSLNIGLHTALKKSVNRAYGDGLFVRLLPIVGVWEYATKKRERERER